MRPRFFAIAITDWLTPIRSAKFCWPFAAEMAFSSSSMHLGYHYSEHLGNNKVDQSDVHSVNTDPVFKDRLYAARKHRGMTQGTLAKSVGLGTTAITNLESGKNASSTKTVELAQVLGCNPEWLATGKGKPNYDKHDKVRAIVSAYRQMDARKQKLLEDYIDLLLESQESRAPSPAPAKG